MRILNIDGLMLVGAFRELGHEVLCAGFQDSADIRITSPRDARSLYREACGAGFVPDCVFWCDLSNLPYLPGIEELPCATAFYSIDTYCHHWHFSFANAFDFVFAAQKDHIPLFPVDEVGALWLPLFAPCAPETDCQARDIPVSFVGNRNHPNNPDREFFLRNFKSLQPLFLFTGPYAEIFSRSRIVLNQTACSEVNFRCFEAMSHGAALLMEQCGHGIEELFTPGEDILPLYRRNNWRQAVETARQALAAPARLAEVAARGRDNVLRNHLARHRAQTVIKCMEDIIRGNIMQKRLDRLEYRRLFLASAYAMLGCGLADRLGAVYADYYFFLASKADSRTLA